MNKKTVRSLSAGLAGVALALAAWPAHAHHSFAAYTDAIGFSFVGVVTAVIPDANHLQIQFAVINADRTGYVYVQERDPATGELHDKLVNGQRVPVVANLEYGGAAAQANAGITVNRFQPGTIISTGANPLRTTLPLEAGVQGADERGGALFTGELGGDGFSNESLAVCSFAGEPVRLPAPGQFCDSVEGGAAATFGGENPGAIPQTTGQSSPVVEWASWAFSPTSVTGDTVQDRIF